MPATPAPWTRPRPTGAVDVETDDDDFVTVDKWPKTVFLPHYHEEFNWLVPMRPGRFVVAVEGVEHAFDGDHWLCVFPRVPHAVVHLSDDCEILSLFLPSAVMHDAYAQLAAPPPIERTWILGGEPTIAQGLALAWGEARFAKRRGDPFDTALATYVAGWLWRHYAAPIADDAGVRLRAAFGADGAAIAAFFERHLAEQPFPWPALAKLVGSSTRTLQRRFVLATGHTPSAVLRALRLDRARELLTDPSRPVGDVAVAAGYASQAHFATEFRTAYGVSPTAFRKGPR